MTKKVLNCETYKLSKRALRKAIISLEKAAIQMNIFNNVMAEKLGEYHNCEEGVTLIGKKQEIELLLAQMLLLVREIHLQGYIILEKE